jgi:hypothetical protein
MQAQTQMSKGELLLEMQGKTVSRTIKEISPMGVRMQINDEGQATGKFNANTINTVNVFLKTDGTNEWESKGLQTTKEGDMIVVSSRGTGRMANPTTGTWQGDAIFMTQSPKLAWLNNTKGWIEGSGDMAQGTYHGKIYAKK